MKILISIIFLLFLGIDINAQNLITVQKDGVSKFYKVKNLANKGKFTTGVHRLNWDGRNAGNAEVSPGIYHLKIDIDGAIFHRKIVYSK